ncbi:hypothetical protein BJV74DRAFT_526037 [Russula compacta]|nr:hypothetical protein BJV74DRAFT_526037 [Russula compacta]
MTHVINGEPANFMVHFLHSDHPRHGFWVMSTTPHVHYEFQTPFGLATTHTMVTTRNGTIVATFDWIGPSAPGTVTWLGPPAHRDHMCELVRPCNAMENPLPPLFLIKLTPSSSREFSCEGPDHNPRRFWWHRLQRNGRYYDYDLYAAHEPEDVCIGLFRQHERPEVLDIGINYATFYFSFWHESLLLHALLALSLNRWFDSQGWP